MAQSQQVQRLRPIPAMIFAARRLQLPLYLGLILAMGIRYHEEHQA